MRKRMAWKEREREREREREDKLEHKPEPQLSLFVSVIRLVFLTRSSWTEPPNSVVKSSWSFF